MCTVTSGSRMHQFSGKAVQCQLLYAAMAMINTCRSGEPVNFEFISTLAVPFGKTCYIIMCYIIIITSAKEVM